MNNITGFDHIVHVDFEMLDENGFDSKGFDCDGFDCNGFDRDGFDINGFDAYGEFPTEKLPDPPAEIFVTI